ncbi:helix-turn-helix protein [Roseibium marinum]|uniref:Helix-turn-helix protein n=2 Tax=Roseibium marinum TaxID=281252 RepID=A0A2S3UYA0_9HYPH|nr:helix-turn-helix protein [Roseibium marinum]
MTPDQLAKTLKISRAALYRAEKGEIRKIEMLTSIADVLGVSLTSLMGVEVEYLSTSISFFERMRQIEEESQQLIGMFSPVSYLLTSDQYDSMLYEALLESISRNRGDKVELRNDIDLLMEILKKRKTSFHLRRPLIASIISLMDIERFLIFGVVGRHDLDPKTVEKRRQVAYAETERILGMFRSPEIGVQIGLVREPIPTTSFQIFRQESRSLVAVSPFRLGDQPNTRIGVGLITGAPEALTLHEKIAEELWSEAEKGEQAAKSLEEIMSAFGVG